MARLVCFAVMRAKHAHRSTTKPYCLYAMSQPSLDARLLLIDAADNCLILRCPLSAGTRLQIEGVAVVLATDLDLGQKLARRDIRAGEKVLRYGAVIGAATRAIRAGEHIHVHNLASGYLPTRTS